MQRTPFHLVEFSPWPIIASIAVLIIPLGLLTALKFKTNIFLLIATALLSLISYLWWRDTVRESTYQGWHTSYVVSGLKTGILLFIISEVCFFAAFFWAFFHRSLRPNIEVGSVWPPVGITVLNPFQVPLLNTSVLLLSGVAVTWAHHSLIEGHSWRAISGLFLTCTLGCYFLILQYSEYIEAPFSISDGIYGRTFYVATGFHGLHVIVGTLFLIVCLGRIYIHHFSKNHHTGFVAAAWYWHFVDVVWLFLYVRIYWWGSCVDSLYNKSWVLVKLKMNFIILNTN